MKNYDGYDVALARTKRRENGNLTIGIRGMTCGGCVKSVQRGRSSSTGLKVEVFAQRGGEVEYDATRPIGAAHSAIEGAGFEIVP